MNFENKGFVPQVGYGGDNSYQTPRKEFEKDSSDNPLFREIQVGDVSKVIRPETVFYADFDMAVYQAASNLEQNRIRATHKLDPSLVIDCKGIREFKGLGKKIADSSELGVLNLKRSVEGLEPLVIGDFDIVKYQNLNKDEDKAFETAKIQIYKKLKEYRLQYDIPKVIPVLGEGESFRESYPTCRRYKGNRQGTLRPLLLKKLRQWVVDEVGGVMTTDTRNGKVVECDDKIEMFAAQGYQHYRKHGWFHIGVISGDKDSMNSPKLLINADRYHGGDKTKQGKLRFPKALLIEATDRCCGDLELISKTDSKGNTSQEVKGYGFKFLMFQAFLGLDSADNYDALSHLGQGIGFGISSAYKVLKPCKTAQECLQACIDVFADKLAYGVQYTDHLNVEHDVDTATYMNVYFKVAYMLRSVNDTMDFYKLCEAFKVDTSKIVGNNKLSPPQRTFAPKEEALLEIKSIIEDVLSSHVKGLKAKKKVDAAIDIDAIKNKLEWIDFEMFYEMRQFKKDL